MMLERCLFVFAITVPFDIRDMEGDKKSGLKTLPLMIGEKRARNLAIYALILFMGISSIHYYFFSFKIGFILAFFISGISTIIFIKSEGIKDIKHYHYGILDGTMILQAVLVIFLNWLCYNSI
jgi:4-hydroxybenzoate polyprenyltransferase